MTKTDTEKEHTITTEMTEDKKGADKTPPKEAKTERTPAEEEDLFNNMPV